MDRSTGVVLFAVVAAFVGIAYGAYLIQWILKLQEGSEKMKTIAKAIQEGANAYLNRQYTTVAYVAAGLFAVLWLAGLWSEKFGLLTAVGFLIGAVASASAGYVGMKIAVRANVRTAQAAHSGLNAALQVAFKGGAVTGLLLIGLGLFAVSGFYYVASAISGPGKAMHALLSLGFGGSLISVFARVGGGIFTKAADVGADLVGKVEAGIPEDDPRNAAVVADLVGDNVGDCAGRGADLFESMSAENIGAMILGVAIYKVTGDLQWVVFPLVLRSFGIFATIAGLTSVPLFAREDGRQDPMTPLNYGYYSVSALSVIGLFIATIVMLGHEWYWFFFCGLIGIGTGIAFVYITQYYTSGGWRPVQDIAEASRTGPATNIITGTAVGMETTAATAIAIGIALVASFALGSRADIPGVGGFTTGVFGTAVATMGMLMSAAYILSMDTFGPITDNAGGITEYSGAPESARHITDALDSVGNTTKALTKGYAVASAGLAAFLLFSAYLDKVKERLDIPLNQQLPIDLSSVDVFVGGLIGVMLVFLFSSLAIRAVGNAAGAIIEEVRRQFREDPGIMAG